MEAPVLKKRDNLIKGIKQIRRIKSGTDDSI